MKKSLAKYQNNKTTKHQNFSFFARFNSKFSFYFNLGPKKKKNIIQSK